MGIVTNVLLCSFVVVMAQSEVMLERDMPYQKVKLGAKAILECCCSGGKSLKVTWVKTIQVGNRTNGPKRLNVSDDVTAGEKTLPGKTCGTISFKSAKMTDSGIYQCWLNGSGTALLSHGTYLHVYKPLDRTINLRESTKNKILTAEGVLLWLCVLLPSTTLLFQSRRLNELERKKVKKEEENIYQGLNLDDCCTTYDQIERSQTHGPYQDVCNIMEEEEDIQLEKP